jgi:hypothetical protein
VVIHSPAKQQASADRLTPARLERELAEPNFFPRTRRGENFFPRTRRGEAVAYSQRWGSGTLPFEEHGRRRKERSQALLRASRLAPSKPLAPLVREHFFWNRGGSQMSMNWRRIGQRDRVHSHGSTNVKDETDRFGNDRAARWLAKAKSRRKWKPKRSGGEAMKKSKRSRR